MKTKQTSRGAKRATRSTKRGKANMGVVFGVRLDKSVKEEADKRAMQLGFTPSEAIRALVESFAAGRITLTRQKPVVATPVVEK